MLVLFPPSGPEDPEGKESRLVHRRAEIPAGSDGAHRRAQPRRGSTEQIRPRHPHCRWACARERETSRSPLTLIRLKGNPLLFLFRGGIFSMLVAQGQWERLGTRSLVFVPVKVRKNS